MNASAYRLTSQRIDLYCKVRLADLLPPDDLDRLRDYLDGCLTRSLFPPYRGRAVDTVLIAEAAGIEPHVLAPARSQIQPICRALADQPLASPPPKREHRRRTSPEWRTADRTGSPATRAKPVPKPRPIDEHPEPLWSEWEEPEDFAPALALHITRHGETVGRLARAITATGVFLDRLTLDKWVKGISSPSSLTSLQALDRIEHRYRLPAGSLRAKLPRSGRAVRGNVLDDIPRPERRRLAWHLPEDFSRRPITEQEEILIPSVAFKNANSSFFGSKPFRLILPDLGGLYAMIGAWIDRHRARLLGPAEDTGAFFVKSVKQTSANAAYDQNTVFEAWRLTIQRYGIYNPYTDRGAIVGLLPHGPHNVRDVLATHIFKATGSYEQASYAIQDTPEMVAQHYGRFLPQDKAEIAARILNQVWEAA